MAVYLSGDSIRHLDWTMETSTRLMRRQYYFDGAAPCLVVETIHEKFDARAEPLTEPRLVSTRSCRLDASSPPACRREFLDHAEFLMNEFRSHRKEFARAGNVVM